MGVRELGIARYVKTRWLSLEASLSRLLLNWESIQKYIKSKEKQGERTNQIGDSEENSEEEYEDSDEDDLEEERSYD